MKLFKQYPSLLSHRLLDNNRCAATSLIIVTTTMVALLSVPHAAKAQIVQNGEFESVLLVNQGGSPTFSTNPADIPNWTHSGATGDALLWRVGYSDSGGSIIVDGSGGTANTRQFVTMGGGFNGGAQFSAWSQVLTGLTANTTYTLNFKMASESTTSQSITVDFPTGSNTVAQIFTTPPSDANYWRTWTPKTMNFFATGTTTTLRFSVTQPQDVGLDSVSVTPLAGAAAPEPGSIALALTGSGPLLLGLARRRNKKAAQAH